MAPPPISGGAPVVTIGFTGCTTVVTSPEGFTVPKIEVSIGCSSAQSIDAVVPGQAVQVILNDIHCITGHYLGIWICGCRLICEGGSKGGYRGGSI